MEKDGYVNGVQWWDGMDDGSMDGMVSWIDYATEMMVGWLECNEGVEGRGHRRRAGDECVDRAIGLKDTNQRRNGGRRKTGSD